MSRAKFLLTWIACIVICSLLGHHFAQRILAIPDYGNCPLVVNNTSCPSCFVNHIVIGEYVNFKIGCDTRMFNESYKTCVEGGSDPCINSYGYTCRGFINEKLDCSGISDPSSGCSRADFFGCKSVKDPP